MKVEAWIHFEEPNEKADLIKIMEENVGNNVLANMAIQERFGLDMTDANSVIEMYYKRIKK